jgi:hypothetical protein
MEAAPELVVIGLTCNLVGIFLLANSIIFRSPRRLIEEFFGVDRGSLRPLRDYILNKIQVVIGFLFLTAGFLLQGLSAWSQIEKAALVLGICGALVAFAFGVYFVGAVYSRRSFRKHLSEFFRQNPFPFEKNMRLTKQIGRVFGIEESPDDSVEDYAAKVGRALGIDPKDRQGFPERSIRQRMIREMAPEPRQSAEK